MEQSEWMKLISALLMGGMLAVSGCSKEDQMWATGEVITSAFRYACRYSPDLVKKAEGGDAEAQNTLGMSYLMGSGITQDPKKALTWFKKSAEQGNAGAQCSLAACYLSGIGAEIDEEKAVSGIRKRLNRGMRMQRKLSKRLRRSSSEVGSREGRFDIGPLRPTPAQAGMLLRRGWFGR